MTQTVLQSVQAHWQDLRGRTYDLLDVLSDADLNARLPFPESPEHPLPVLLHVGYAGELAARPAGRAHVGLGLQPETGARRRNAAH